VLEPESKPMIFVNALRGIEQIISRNLSKSGNRKSKEGVEFIHNKAPVSKSFQVKRLVAARKIYK
jgi:hypothetical protein